MYLALGDSIATGTLHNFARVTSYTEYLYHCLLYTSHSMLLHPLVLHPVAVLALPFGLQYALGHNVHLLHGLVGVHQCAALQSAVGVLAPEGELEEDGRCLLYTSRCV